MYADCHVYLWHLLWHIESMRGAIKKVTVHLPVGLVKKAQKATGTGLTDTIRRGLELVSAEDAYETLRSLRGKVRFSMDLSTLREDRN